MKLLARKAAFCSVLLSGMLLLNGGKKVHADEFYWAGDSGILAQWDEILSWSEKTDNLTGGAKPTLLDSLVFGDYVGSGATPVTPASNVLLWGTGEQGGSITFNGSQSFTIGQGTDLDEKLTLSGAGTISNTGSGNQIFKTRIEYSGAGTPTISNTGTGQLVFEGPVNRPGAGLTISAGSTSEVLFANSVTAGDVTVNGVTGGSVHFDGQLNSTSLSVSNVAAVFGPTSSVNVSGLVTISNGGSLAGGVATFEGRTVIADGGVLIASNDGASSLTFTEGLEFQAGSKLSWTLDSSSVPINVGDITFDEDFLAVIDLPEGLALADLDINGPWVVFTGVETISGTLADNFELRGFADVPVNGFTWISDIGAGTISLSVAAVPEPSTMVLLGVAGAIGGVVARRRAKRDQIKDTADSAVTA